MAGVLVDRATSDQLIGPDWAMNLEICDVLTRDPGQSKDAIRVLRKRLGSRNPKVQLLALTLLETVIKNCSEIVHMHVAEKDLPHKMVKMVKRKQPDPHVREKILMLIDTWQEAFGGSQARYLQYYAAYQELLRAGAVFPRRSERSSAPMFTPLHERSLTSHPHPQRTTETQQDKPESSNGSELPPLSLTDIQNARGVMDVLSEMINALDPANKEGIKQEVIVDLLGQCHSYKRRVLELVNNTFMNEELLSQGLALNDDLERVLTKYESIALGTVTELDKPKSLQALVDIDDYTDNQASNTQPDGRSTSNMNPSTESIFDQLLLPAPPVSNGAAASSQIDPHVDLLSGEGYNTPTTENSLALVPIGEPLEGTASEQSIVAVSDMFLQNNVKSNGDIPTNHFDLQSGYPTVQADAALPQLQLQQQQQLQLALYSNGSLPSPGAPGHEQTAYIQGVQASQSNLPWNDHATPGLSPQQHALDYGATDQGGAFPPPPWEAQPGQSSPTTGPHCPPLENSDLGGMHSPTMQSNQYGGIYSQPVQGAQLGIMPQSMQGGQMIGYAYGQQPGTQYYDQRLPYPYSTPNEISQRMYGLSMQDSSTYMNINTNRNPSYQMPISNKPSKPEDKLFGDLVSMAKSKPK